MSQLATEFNAFKQSLGDGSSNQYGADKIFFESRRPLYGDWRVLNTTRQTTKQQRDKTNKARTSVTPVDVARGENNGSQENIPSFPKLFQVTQDGWQTYQIYQQGKERFRVSECCDNYPHHITGQGGKGHRHPLYRSLNNNSSGKLANPGIFFKLTVSYFAGAQIKSCSAFPVTHRLNTVVYYRKCTVNH